MEENTKEYRISTDSVKIAVSDVSRIVLSHESETKYELEHKKGDVSHRGFPDFWKIYYYENRVWHNTTWGIFLYEDEIYSDSRYKIVGDDIHVKAYVHIFYLDGHDRIVYFDDNEGAEMFYNTLRTKIPLTEI